MKGAEAMFLFQTRSFWKIMNIPHAVISKKYKEYFGEDKEITDRKEAISILRGITENIQNKMVFRIKTEDTYAMLFKLHYIFDEVHSLYLKEKKARLELVKQNVDATELLDEFIKNSQIERNIIDACNIWIENCILLQHDVNIKNVNIKKQFVMDNELIIDMFLYGLISRSISLLSLSKNVGDEHTYYGLKITLKEDNPAEVLKYHPFIFFNTAIVGNQDSLDDNMFTVEADSTEFGKGFFKQMNVHFLPFLAVLQNFEHIVLRGDDKSLTVISKKDFIEAASCYSTPAVDGEEFYNSFVLTKDKLQSFVRKKESIIWIMGANKVRHEIMPFIELDDGNIFISYGAVEQSKQLWYSYFNNGGSYYTIPDQTDELKIAMEKRNKQLSDVLLEKLQEILRANYSPDVDLRDVDYDNIFGKKDQNYGDYDIVFFSKDAKELFLIESKYFSDSLNASGAVNDYNKMFGENGYYEHCRKRYDLVLAEPEKLKAFIGAEEKIKVHMLFVSSKPLEMELHDKDGVVTFLSLNIFEKYIQGKLISGEDDSIIETKFEI